MELSTTDASAKNRPLSVMVLTTAYRRRRPPVTEANTLLSWRYSYGANERSMVPSEMPSAEKSRILTSIRLSVALTSARLVRKSAASSAEWDS